MSFKITTGDQLTSIELVQQSSLKLTLEFNFLSINVPNSQKIPGNLRLKRKD